MLLLFVAINCYLIFSIELVYDDMSTPSEWQQYSISAATHNSTVYCTSPPCTTLRPDAGYGSISRSFNVDSIYTDFAVTFDLYSKNLPWSDGWTSISLEVWCNAGSSEQLIPYAGNDVLYRNQSWLLPTYCNYESQIKIIFGFTMSGLRYLDLQKILNNLTIYIDELYLCGNSLNTECGGINIIPKDICYSNYPMDETYTLMHDYMKDDDCWIYNHTLQQYAVAGKSWSDVITFVGWDSCPSLGSPWGPHCMKLLHGSKAYRININATNKILIGISFQYLFGAAAGGGGDMLIVSYLCNFIDDESITNLNNISWNYLVSAAYCDNCDNYYFVTHHNLPVTCNGKYISIKFEFNTGDGIGYALVDNVYITTGLNYSLLEPTMSPTNIPTPKPSVESDQSVANQLSYIINLMLFSVMLSLQ